MSAQASRGAAQDCPATSRALAARGWRFFPSDFALGLRADKIASAVIVKLTRGSRPSGVHIVASKVPVAANASPSTSTSSASIAASVNAKIVHHFASGPFPSRAEAMRYGLPALDVLRTASFWRTTLRRAWALIARPLSSHTDRAGPAP